MDALGAVGGGGCGGGVGAEGETKLAEEAVDLCQRVLRRLRDRVAACG